MTRKGGGHPYCPDLAEPGAEFVCISAARSVFARLRGELSGFDWEGEMMPRHAAVRGWLVGLLVAGAWASAAAQPALPPTPKLPDLPKLPATPKLPPYDQFPPPPAPKVRPGVPAVDSRLLPTPTPTPTPAGVPVSEGLFGPVPGPEPLLEVPGKPFGRPAPLPGSVEDEYTRELIAREEFRTYTWRGTGITAFPNNLLWDPGLAVQKDPRMKATYSNQPNFRGSNSLDTSIGGTQGLYRFDFIGQDLQVQTDIFGVVHTRLSPEDVTFADYRFGLPFTAKLGWWQAKFAYEHTSSHLGDRLLRAIPQPVPSYARDEIVIGFGRILYDQLRVYGHYAYAFQLIVPGVEASRETRSRVDIGFEWYDRRATGFWGTPYVAGNVEWMGSQGNRPNYDIQAGWMFRNPSVRLGQFRVFVEHYRGQSPFSINSNVRETFTAGGIAFDY